MKGQMLQLFTVLILLLVIFVYARVNSLEQAGMRQQVDSVWAGMAQVNSLLRVVGDRGDRQVGKITDLEQRLNANEEQRKQLASKIESLSTEVNVLRSQVANENAPVDLPVIAVNKNSGK
jgi:septal ring factor EnvC (AmiA/AmiB activator)